MDISFIFIMIISFIIGFSISYIFFYFSYKDVSKIDEIRSKLREITKIKDELSNENNELKQQNEYLKEELEKALEKIRQLEWVIWENSIYIKNTKDAVLLIRQVYDKIKQYDENRFDDKINKN